ncbi:MFS transporter [Lactiplantibacillus pentosus]|uniref:MFS transporter n=1 Tax=Lactiplantibacillus pentosus TaxID=1589 RepID=UPI0021A65AF3|nr:MFS transporter [Lactiplantibacillus pentosus]MCT3297805.1 MFS transporter [Lactiplantibacillus pentosus]
MHQRQLSISLYLNYFVHGIGLIILTQNMQALGQHWQTPLATVSYVISGIGIGRLFAYFILGNLSDRFGRKVFVNIGMASSALDSGTYTTFIEMGGRQGSANVLLKAFMSAGEFLLPLLVANLEAQQLWYGWSFMLAAVILLINGVLLNRQQFPVRNQANASALAVRQQISHGRRWLATIGLAGYGYTSMAIMILYTQWISLFATRTFHFSAILAHWLLSLYSIGSISGVLVIFWLLRRGVAETKLLVAMNVGSLVALLVICYSPIAGLSMIAALAFGFTAAGGVMQVALNLFIKLYPQVKGRVTGIYFTFGSIASFTIPLITGWLSQQNVALAMRFDLLIGVAGIGCVGLAAWAIRSPKSLSQERQRINHIDQQIVRLLNERFDTVTAIGELKQQQQLPVLDQQREQRVLHQVAAKSKQTAHTPYLQAIYQAIMRNSRAYQTDLHDLHKEEINHD